MQYVHVIINLKGKKFVHDESDEESLQHWLKEIEFESKYYSFFIENGYKDLDVSCKLNNQLIDLGISNKFDREKLTQQFDLHRICWSRCGWR